MAELSGNLVRSFLNMIEKTDYVPRGSNNVNGLPNFERFISIDLLEDKIIEIPATISNKVISYISTENTDKRSLLIPITMTQNENVRSADMIFRKLTEGYAWNYGIVKFKISSKNETYYALPGIILDENFNHLLYITKRITLNDGGRSIYSESLNVYLNPTLFSSQDSLSKFVMAKFMPFVTKDYHNSDVIEIRVKDMTKKIFLSPKVLNTRGILDINHNANLVIRRGSKAIANSLW